MVEIIARFRCKLCYKEYSQNHEVTEEGLAELKEHQVNRTFVKSVGIPVHRCADGKIGVLDFLGALILE